MEVVGPAHRPSQEVAVVGPANRPSQEVAVDPDHRLFLQLVGPG